jgi:putative hydrolase of the HAD superfamily
MIKYIIFDFDDTLSDFQHCKENAKSKITPYLIAQGIDTESYWKTFEERFEKLFSRYINHELTVREYRIARYTHHGIDEEQAEIYNEIYLKTVNKALLFDDVMPILSDLKEKGYKLYVLTNGPLSQRDKIEACEAGKLFDKIFISAELGVGKPDTKVYDKVIASIGCKGSEALMLGDSFENDCVSAEKAGLAALQINRNNKQITDYKHQISSLSEIYSYLTERE